MTAPENWTRLAAATPESDESSKAANSFWIAALRREERKVNAACRALGGLEYLVGPEFTGNPRTRLRRIREVVAELRDGLGMPPLPPGPIGDTASAMPSTATEQARGGEAA